MTYRWDALPIVYKLFITLIGGIALIIMALLVYLWGYESELMLKKEQDVLHLQSISMANELNFNLNHLQNELRFLSHLEVMDDMVARDMDRRITSILEQKAKDLGESIELVAIAPDLKISASSKPIHMNTIFPDDIALNEAIKKKKSHFFIRQNLYIFTPIYNSFYSQQLLGYLMIIYPMENFALRLKSENNLFRWLTPPDTFIGTYPNLYPNLDSELYLHDSTQLQGILEGWSLHYAIPKREALNTLYHFQTLFLSVFAIGLILIACLVLIIVLRVIKPLKELSYTAKKIAYTGDYSQMVIERGSDEIGVVARSFNALMSATRLSMERIELLGKTQAALRTKSSFLSSMSHELRTPLGSILSLTQYLMTQPQMPDAMRETVGKIENSAHHLLGVINNVLDLARAEAGKMKPNLRECNPAALLNEAVELVYPLAEDKGLKIFVTCDIPEQTFLGDPRLMSQVIINLLSNAIKYTQEGFITIRLDMHGDIYLIQVQDTGCGIADKALKHLFDEFYQVQSSDQESLKGSGLGLAISKRIAVLLQGDLFIKSKGEGHGSTAFFHFRSFEL